MGFSMINPAFLGSICEELPMLENTGASKPQIVAAEVWEIGDFLGRLAVKKHPSNEAHKVVPPRIINGL